MTDIIPSEVNGSKQVAIITHVRGLIVRGEFPAGQRIPTRTEIEDLFQASPLTVQRAFDRLIEDGFVFARGRHGTFVAQQPPHLCHFGIVFPHKASGRQWSRFWIALEQQARLQVEAGGHKLTTYHHDDGHVDSDDFQRLLSDVQSQRLAGLIFALPPHGLERSPVITQPGIPRVVIANTSVAGMPAVYPDTDRFYDRAVEFIASHKHKRVAVIAADHNKHTMDHMDRCIARAGLESAPLLRHRVLAAMPSTAGGIARLLVRLPPKDRPDALIITDDNLVEETAAALADSGTRVPGDLEVVAHWNFPSPTTATLPMRRLGCDCREMIEHCLVMLERLRRRENVPMLTKLPPLFEDEARAKQQKPAATGRRMAAAR